MSALEVTSANGAEGDKNLATVLVVEDDAPLREALCDTLTIAGYTVCAAQDGIDALERIEANLDIGMVLSDVKMPRLDGQDFLARLSTRRPGMPVLMMTAFGSVDGAVRAMRYGAVDYLVKPVRREILLEQVAAHLRTAKRQQNECAPIAVDPSSREVVRLAERVAATEATVMISGESGTGKEVLARYIHNRSSRRNKPFIAINCAAIPESLLEATLFGHEKGAFTGALRSLPGKFEQANGGTLLLDEVTEMNVDLQSKLLRVLQEREVERVGGRTTIALDVRVLATTNRDLATEVGRGHFREDLFYRLNVFPIRLSGLRQRPGDILPIARHLLEGHARQLSGSRKVFSEQAEAALLKHDWLGNVRELDNAVQRAMVMCMGTSVSAQDLQLEACPLASTHSMRNERAVQMPIVTGEEDTGLREQERDLILATLEKLGGSRKQTAMKLGISSRTLRHKLSRMREEGVTVPEVGNGGQYRD